MAAEAEPGGSHPGPPGQTWGHPWAQGSSRAGVLQGVTEKRKWPNSGEATGSPEGRGVCVEVPGTCSSTHGSVGSQPRPHRPGHTVPQPPRTRALA